MRTSKLEIVNPRRKTGYDSDKLSVEASINITVQCESEADQVRALFVLDKIWREIFTELDSITHNNPLPASEDVLEVVGESED